MKRIVIIGPGAGKTTLANELAFLLDIKAYHLDRLFWQRDWKGKKIGMRELIFYKSFVSRNAVDY